jgi:3-oxoacyl-(acyl-carrier-protein) synthase
MHAVAAVSNLDRRLSRGRSVRGPALRLAISAVQQSLPASAENESQGLLLFGGSTHAESDITLQLCLAQTGAAQRDLTAQELNDALQFDTIPSRLATSLGCDVTVGSWCYSSCSSAMSALALAACTLRSGRGEARGAIVVGVDALSFLAANAFDAVGAVTRSGCSPLRSNRDGMLVSEGAAAIRLSCWREPVSPPHGSVALLSLGLSCDAGHATAPDPAGAGVERALRNALRAADISAQAVGGVVMHGTGTIANDEPEAAAVRRVFGRRMPATSLKGAMGHTMGAAGLFNVLCAVEALRTGLLPPCAGRDGPALDNIDLVMREPRSIDTNSVLVAMASGFGGNNAAAILGTVS